MKKEIRGSSRKLFADLCLLPFMIVGLLGKEFAYHMGGQWIKSP
jgi:hypothetical protein